MLQNLRCDTSFESSDHPWQRRERLHRSCVWLCCFGVRSWWDIRYWYDIYSRFDACCRCDAIAPYGLGNVLCSLYIIRPRCNTRCWCDIRSICIVRSRCDAIAPYGVGNVWCFWFIVPSRCDAIAPYVVFGDVCFLDDDDCVDMIRHNHVCINHHIFTNIGFYFLSCYVSHPRILHLSLSDFSEKMFTIFTANRHKIISCLIIIKALQSEVQEYMISVWWFFLLQL